METYSRGDLNGEIYRLNFTCNNGTSNERGCVVFKLNGTTNLSEGKDESRHTLREGRTEEASYREGEGGVRRNV